MPGGEAQHLAGEDGVSLAKRWLNGTRRFEVQWHAYNRNAGPYLDVPQGDRPSESFDFSGQRLDHAREPIGFFYGEAKRYNGEHDQRDQYRKFVTRAYSAMIAWEDSGAPAPSEFMYVTWHPFGKSSDYLGLVSAEKVKECCLHDFRSGGGDVHRRVPEERVDDEHCERLAERLWFLIAPMRIEDMLPEEQA